MAQRSYSAKPPMVAEASSYEGFGLFSPGLESETSLDPTALKVPEPILGSLSSEPASLHHQSLGDQKDRASDLGHDDLDPLLFPQTRRIRELTFECRCDVCAIEYSFKHTDRRRSTGVNFTADVELRSQQRQAVRPKRKKWALFTPYEAAWADEGERLQMLASGLVDLDCKAAWALVDELQSHELKAFLPSLADFQASRKK